MNPRATRRRIVSGSFDQIGLKYAPANFGLGTEDVMNGTILLNKKYIPSTYETKESVSVDFKMKYSIHNKKHILSFRKPVVFVHGGPGIPHHYLKPILDKIKDRSVIFYDQIGCGDSSEPSDINAYSIDLAVDDLQRLIEHLNLLQFHLVGHSYGGIIAFEYVKRCASMRESISTVSASSRCLSITLCSTPFNVREVDRDSERILNDIQEDVSETDAISFFHKTFLCRTDKIPCALEEAYLLRGKIWQGTEVIRDYIANSEYVLSHLPPFLLLRGEFDFVSESQSIGNWKNLVEQSGISEPCKTFVFPDCSHYIMLEDTGSFSNVLVKFLKEVEGKFGTIA